MFTQDFRVILSFAMQSSNVSQDLRSISGTPVAQKDTVLL